jgi:SAM-dependent methyltransferase
MEARKITKMDIASHPAPVRIGSEAEFAGVVRVLREAAFDERTICEALGFDDMSDVGRLTSDDVARVNLSRQLKVLLRLFVVLGLVPRSEVEQVFRQSAIGAFISLGLVGVGEFGDNFHSTVLLYPVHGFWIASDRLTNPDGSPLVEMPDIVFPAIYQGTLQFLQLLPEVADGEALDLCAGTGIGAFALSRTAQRAFSVDVTARASEFARFNRALNGRENVEVLQGDLYEPLGDCTFDCIVAHPPYVPSLGLETIWRDGGVTGDLLIKRIVEGFPGHLRAGGHAMILAQGVDTSEATFEERVHEWLGENADDFDVIFGSDLERGPARVLELLQKKTAPEVIGKLRVAFEAAGVSNMPYGALFVHRVSSAKNHTPWMARARLSKQTKGVDFQATFTVHDRLSSSDFRAKLADSAPRLAPHLEVTVTHVVQQCSLVPAEYVLSTDRPFAKRVRFDDWAIPLLTRFDGTLTVTQIYDAAAKESEVPDGFGLADFLTLVTRSLEVGFLIIPEIDIELPWAF